MIDLDYLSGEAGEPGHAGEPGGAGGRGGAGGAGEPGGRGGEGGAGGRGGDAEDVGASLHALRHSAVKSKGQIHLVNYVTAAVLLFLLGWAIYNGWQTQQAIKIESIKISNVQVLGDSELCPGDVLVIGYSLRVEGLGDIVFNDSVYHGDHPVKFSTTKSLPIPGSRTLVTVDEWTIPPRPGQKINGAWAWAAGEYKRLISVSPSPSYVARFLSPAILEVPFQISEGCN